MASPCRDDLTFIGYVVCFAASVHLHSSQWRHRVEMILMLIGYVVVLQHLSTDTAANGVTV